VVEFVAAGSDAPLSTLPEYSRREIDFLATHEKVVHLDDVLLRRSMLAMLGHATREAVLEIVDVLSGTLMWDADRKGVEIARTFEILRDEHQVEL
jgi:glycerol-3-phosphate dehydrogenase